MEFKVFSEKKEEVCFKLHKLGKNSIALIAVNNKGEELPGGNILIINSEGIHLSRHVNKTIGLPLDSKNRILITKSKDERD